MNWQGGWFGNFLFKVFWTTPPPLILCALILGTESWYWGTGCWSQPLVRGTGWVWGRQPWRRGQGEFGGDKPWRPEVEGPRPPGFASPNSPTPILQGCLSKLTRPYCYFLFLKCPPQFTLKDHCVWHMAIWTKCILFLLLTQPLVWVKKKLSHLI